jgi:hypothetical protein
MGYHRTEVIDSILLSSYRIENGPWQDVYVTSPQKEQLEEWIKAEDRIRQDYHEDPEDPEEIGQMKHEVSAALNSKAKHDKKARDKEELEKIQSDISGMVTVAQFEFEKEDERAARQAAKRPRVPVPIRLMPRDPFLLKKPKRKKLKLGLETIFEE